jgi:hypothetical protein
MTGALADHPPIQGLISNRYKPLDPMPNELDLHPCCSRKECGMYLALVSAAFTVALADPVVRISALQHDRERARSDAATVVGCRGSS